MWKLNFSNEVTIFVMPELNFTILFREVCSVIFFFLINGLYLYNYQENVQKLRDGSLTFLLYSSVSVNKNVILCIVCVLYAD